MWTYYSSTALCRSRHSAKVRTMVRIVQQPTGRLPACWVFPRLGSFPSRRHCCVASRREAWRHPESTCTRTHTRDLNNAQDPFTAQSNRGQRQRQGYGKGRGRQDGGWGEGRFTIQQQGPSERASGRGELVGVGDGAVGPQGGVIL